MSEQPIRVTPGEVGVVTIDRPGVYNALNAQVLRDLDRAHATLVADPQCRAVVITGAGDRAFSAGADLDEITGLDVDTARDFVGLGQRVFRTIEQGPVPVIAAVNGLALGGGFELVLACSFSVLSTTASVGLPEAGLGLIPGYGGTQRLARAIGRPTALHTMLTGARLDAERCYQLGLTPVPPVPPADLLDVALDQARKVAEKAPRAVASVIEATTRGEDVGLDVALGLETALAAEATVSSESREGIAAFLAKRPPSFPPRRRESR